MVSVARCSAASREHQPTISGFGEQLPRSLSEHWTRMPPRDAWQPRFRKAACKGHRRSIRHPMLEHACVSGGLARSSRRFAVT